MLLSMQKLHLRTGSVREMRRAGSTWHAARFRQGFPPARKRQRPEYIVSKFSSNAARSTSDAMVVNSKAAAILASLGLTGTVYMVPDLLKETKNGLYIAYHYPYELLYEDSWQEFAWCCGVGLMGMVLGMTTFTSLNRRGGYVKRFLENYISVVVGVVTAKVFWSQSQTIVKAGHMVSKVFVYSVDGLIADVFGRGDSMAVWERDDKLTAEMIEEMKSKREELVQQRRSNLFSLAIDSAPQSGQPRSKEDINQIDDLQVVLDRIRDAGDSNGAEAEVELQQLLERHRYLAIRGICQLRKREAEISRSIEDMQRTKGLSHGTRHEGKARQAVVQLQLQRQHVVEQKKQLKLDIQSLHRESLSSLVETEIRLTATRLTDLRLRQLRLATEAARREGADLVVRLELKQLDKQKLEIKLQSRKLFDVDICRFAQSVKPWPRVLADVGKYT